MHFKCINAQTVYFSGVSGTLLLMFCLLVVTMGLFTCGKYLTVIARSTLEALQNANAEFYCPMVLINIQSIISLLNGNIYS